MSKNNLVILPGGQGQTQKQQSAAAKQDELPPCAGNPSIPCLSGATDFMIKGYDDKLRCNRCNAVHVELVYKEAGESAPNTEPQFVAPKLDTRVQSERAARINALHGRLSDAGVVGSHTEASPRILQPGEAVDMRDAMTKDEQGTRAGGISDDERRRRIMAKYSKKKEGGKLIR